MMILGLKINLKFTVKKFNMKKNYTLIGILLWFIFVTLFSIVVTSCNGYQNKIDDGDKVVKCVIDSEYVSPPHSTIEIEPTYVYITDCGNRIVSSRKDVYSIGDTITYVYKKK